MRIIWEGLLEAIRLLFSGNAEVWEITLLSLKVSGLATGISLLIGLPLGTGMALGRFRGRKLALSLVNTGMALPPVVVGLDRLDLPVAQRTAGRFWVDLHPDCHRDRPTDHCRSGGHRADGGCPAAGRSAAAPAAAGTGRFAAGR